MSYFAVFIPEISPTISEKGENEKGSSLVFREMSQVLETLKKHKDKNPRFKIFPTFDEARRFVIDGGGDESSNDNSISRGEQRPSTPRPPPASSADELPRPFPAPTRPELTDFKKAIESKNIVKVRQLIDANPRYLINCNGDTPTIVQEGFRYNAMHIAARVGHLETAVVILQLFRDETCAYVRRLYPDDIDDETTTNRRRLLLDFYLNTPDKGFNETPLHFASKNGYVDIVKFLCSFEECQRMLVNKNGSSAKDLVRESDRIPEKAKKEIQRLLEHGAPSYYIPLYRARDEAFAPILRRPSSPGFPQTRLRSDENSDFDLKSGDYRLAAYIGPVDSDVAENLYAQWAFNDGSPPSVDSTKSKQSSTRSESKIATIAVKRSDLHKGMEQIGRRVASSGNYGWSEYWNFLRLFVDLRTESGLRQLEDYFRQKAEKDEENFTIELKAELGRNGDGCRRKLDFGDQIDEGRDDDSSRDSSDLYFDANEDDEIGAGDNSIGKSAKRSDFPISDQSIDGDESEMKDGFFTPPQELMANVIFGQEPSKLDRDVFATLENVDIDEKRFPRTAAWMKMIRDFSDEDRRRWVPLDSPRSATAIRQKLAFLRASD